MNKHLAFVNDKPLIFSQVYNGPPDMREGMRIISEQAQDLDSVVSMLEGDKTCSGVNYLSDSPERSWQNFVSRYTLVEAAGGLVHNDKMEFLMIFRRGKWDLPKGKIDYDESPEEAAVREVEEECGIEGLEIVKELPRTYHTFPQNKKRILKKTHWYLMVCDQGSPLIPQEEEDIDKVEWMNENSIRKIVFDNTYFSIKNFLENYFSQSQSS